MKEGQQGCEEELEELWRGLDNRVCREALEQYGTWEILRARGREKRITRCVSVGCDLDPLWQCLRGTVKDLLLVAFWLVYLSPGIGGHRETGPRGALQWMVATAFWLPTSIPPPYQTARHPQFLLGTPPSSPLPIHSFLLRLALSPNSKDEHVTCLANQNTTFSPASPPHCLAAMSD